MSELISLQVVERDDVGKGASRRLRRSDLIPAIVYGGDEEALQITVEGKVIRRLMQDELFYSQIITLEVNGKKQETILKDVQRHPAKEYAMHLDFLRVDAAHAITTHIALHFLNEDNCIGVKAGGAITHARVDVEVKCLPADLPEYIEVDMASINIGENIHLSDLKLPKGVELVALLQGEGRNLEVSSVHKTRGGIEEDGESDSEESN